MSDFHVHFLFIFYLQLALVISVHILYNLNESKYLFYSIYVTKKCGGYFVEKI